MSGPNRRTVPESFPWIEGFPQYVGFLKRFAGQAAAQGVTLAIEPINDEEHSFVSTEMCIRDSLHVPGQGVGASRLGRVVDVGDFSLSLIHILAV